MMFPQKTIFTLIVASILVNMLFDRISHCFKTFCECQNNGINILMLKNKCSHITGKVTFCVFSIISERSWIYQSNVYHNVWVWNFVLVGLGTLCAYGGSKNIWPFLNFKVLSIYYFLLNASLKILENVDILNMVLY